MLSSKDGVEHQSIPEKAEELVSQGWSLRVVEIKGKKYLYARKYNMEERRRREKCVGRITDKDVEELEKRGLLKPPAAINTTTHRFNPREAPQSINPRDELRNNANPQRSGLTHNETPVSSGTARGGIGGCFMAQQISPLRVHHLVLRFTKPWVNPSRLKKLAEIGSAEVRFVERSKQYVAHLELGLKRSLTIQVNSKGTAQVFLESSSNPFDVRELPGVCNFLLFLFQLITGREVSMDDFLVVTAPDVNVDLDGVALLEGVKSLSLRDYYNSVISRIYTVEPGAKVSMPNGGTRIERAPAALKNRKLGTLIKYLDSFYDLLQAQSTVYEKLTSIEQSIAGLRTSIDKQFKKLYRKLATRQYRVTGAPKGEEDTTFDDLPPDLKNLLKKMEKDKYVRIYHNRIAYGDEVWKNIHRRKGNIDEWFEKEAIAFGREKNLFLAVMRVLRYYDNKFNGETGIPYSAFLKKFKEVLSELDSAQSTQTGMNAGAF